MKVWIFSPYGPIPEESWREYRFAALARELSIQNHSTVWWTANYSHHFKTRRSVGWKDIHIDPRFIVRLVPVSRYRANIGLRRLLFELTYAINAFRAARKNQDSPDIIVGVDPPQIVGYFCGRLAKKRNIAVVLDVLDLWPELFIMAFPTIIKPIAPILLRPLRQCRAKNLKRANAVSSLCNTYLEVIKTILPDPEAGKAITIFNGIDVSAFRKTLGQKVADSRAPYGLRKEVGEIWAIYAGSLGPNYDIDTLLGACLLLEREFPGIKMLVVGDGPLKGKVTEFIKEHIPGNLRYFEPINQAGLIHLYSLCDIALSAYGKTSNVAMPDKAYDYLAAGLAIVNSLKGEFEKILYESGAGINYEAGDDRSLADALKYLASDHPKRCQLAEASWGLAEEYDRVRQYRRMVKFLVEVRGNYKE